MYGCGTQIFVRGNRRRSANSCGHWTKVTGDETLHDRGHFARRRFAQSKLRLIRGDRPFGGSIDLLVEPGVFERESLGFQSCQLVVDRLETKVVDHQVGGSVVADGDHERERVLQREGMRRVKKEKHTGARDLILFPQHQAVVEVDAAGANLLERCVEDAQLDNRSGRDWLVGIDRNRFPGGKIVRVQSDLAVEAGRQRPQRRIKSGVVLAGGEEAGREDEQSKGNACRSHGWQFSIREVHCGAGIAEYQRARSMWT